MKSCLNCGLCYQDPNNDSYRCMRGVRQPVKDIFVLGRIRCTKHVEVEIILDEAK